MLREIKSLTAPRDEQPLAQIRRIVCRMIGDLVQPWVFRSGNMQPWVPTFGNRQGRTRISSPSQVLPPQCNVGFDPHAPVSWQDAVRILPCMADERVLQLLEREIRKQACLLPDDTLAVVNLGPQMAAPVPTREVEFVRSSVKEKGKDTFKPHADSNNAPVTLPPCLNRPLHAMLRQPGLPLCMHDRVLLHPPHPVCLTEQHVRDNMAAMRSLFLPAAISDRLVVSSQGMADMLTYPAGTQRPDLFNALMVRQQVIMFVNQACIKALYGPQLSSLIGPFPATFGWGELAKHAGLGQAYINTLVHHYPKIQMWTPTGTSSQPSQHHAQKGVLYHTPSLRFKPPMVPETSPTFLQELLSPANALLVHANADEDAFWRWVRRA